MFRKNKVQKSLSSDDQSMLGKHQQLLS